MCKSKIEYLRQMLNSFKLAILQLRRDCYHIKKNKTKTSNIYFHSSSSKVMSLNIEYKFSFNISLQNLNS